MKKGFTLIELLAVIVILAIIALIATPIILGIINDARKESNERSVELYASAVRNAIASYQLTHPNAPTKFSDLDIQYDGEVECAKEELYADGSFYITDCTVNGDAVDYAYGTKQLIRGKMSSVCNPINVQTKGTYTAGDKYECDVDPNKEGYDYLFYVLNTLETGATSVNLIMDSNINKSGNAVKGEESDLGKIAWYADDLDNSYGPITAMNYLQKATEGWTNVNLQTINTFTSCSNKKTCTNKSMAEYKVNARMPYLSEINFYSENPTNAYLYDNLELVCYSDDLWTEEIDCSEALDDNKSGLDVEGLEHIKNVFGYWLLSSSPSNSNFAWNVPRNGSFGSTYISDGNLYGVRPVINLTI